jgi:pyridoxal phosphate enzyme (YggS family)
MNDAGIEGRLGAVRARLESAAIRAGRDPADITLIAVSKTQPADRATAAVAAGVSDLGENRVQEGAAKRPDVSGRARWHLIGPLQRNKVKAALEVFDIVHTLDRESLADRLQFLLSEHGPDRSLPVLIEVNVGREEQKKGVLPGDASGLARMVLERCPALKLVGLMAIPPFAADPEDTRPYFKALRELKAALTTEFEIPLPHLSMGMSHDFDVAIAEGATMVRVGTAIFGPRQKR